MLSESEKGALVVLATSYGGDYQQMLAKVTNDYILGDTATIEQVKAYGGVKLLEYQPNYWLIGSLVAIGLAAYIYGEKS